MTEAIEGEVGRSFVHNGQEYWARSINDPNWQWDALDAEDHYRPSNWDFDRTAFRLQWMVRPSIDSRPFIVMTGF